MQFQITPAQRTPIYQQLVQQVRAGIARGELQAEEKLPSVRQVSRDLVVNPNTVARAYTELEREGLLVTRPGLGVFVAASKSELTKDARKRRVVDCIDELLTTAINLQLNYDEVLKLMNARAQNFQWPQ